MKFQSAQKRKLIVEEEVIEENLPQQKTTKIIDDKIVEAVEELKSPMESSSTKWSVKDSKTIPKKASLLGIVRTNKNKVDNVKPETSVCELKTAPSGLGLLGAYSDSENSDE